MHRPHQYSVPERREAQFERGRQMRIAGCHRASPFLCNKLHRW
ncbi:hypothetical protein L810_4572 [Burkholderia sp. AU4i]|nr:hypothetical protein L810_4572 [Burkholderia sp. AU4i]